MKCITAIERRGMQGEETSVEKDTQVSLDAYRITFRYAPVTNRPESALFRNYFQGHRARKKKYIFSIIILAFQEEDNVSVSVIISRLCVHRNSLKIR